MIIEWEGWYLSFARMQVITSLLAVCEIVAPGGSCKFAPFAAFKTSISIVMSRLFELLKISVGRMCLDIRLCQVDRRLLLPISSARFRCRELKSQIANAIRKKVVLTMTCPNCWP